MLNSKPKVGPTVLDDTDEIMLCNQYPVWYQFTFVAILHSTDVGWRSYQYFSTLAN